MAPLSPATVTGVVESTVEPSPSWPTLLFPQHLTDPPVSTAQVWYEPAPIAIALVRPVTFTGVAESTVVPLPSWPTKLLPQHRTPPALVSAQAYWPPVPALIAVTPLNPGIATGV